MSKHNKVNKSNYDQAGRLTPDDMARERQKQRAVVNKEADTRPARDFTGPADGSEASSPHRTGREE